MGSKVLKMAQLDFYNSFKNFERTPTFLVLLYCRLAEFLTLWRWDWYEWSSSLFVLYNPSKKNLRGMMRVPNRPIHKTTLTNPSVYKHSIQGTRKFSCKVWWGAIMLVGNFRIFIFPVIHVKFYGGTYCKFFRLKVLQRKYGVITWSSIFHNKY